MKHEVLHYAESQSPVGHIIAVVSHKGLAALRLVENDNPQKIVKDIAQQFPGATLVKDDRKIAPVLRQIEEVMSGRLAASRVPLDLHGTPFQKRVWKELARVPWGKTYTYSDLARKAGNPKAVRAVASCCARNPIAFVVPCHRILRKGGGLGGYYWGLDRKRELLEREKD